MSEWRNWQTRKTKDLVPVRVWGFKSPLRHHILVVTFETRTLCGGSGLVFFGHSNACGRSARPATQSQPEGLDRVSRPESVGCADLVANFLGWAWGRCHRTEYLAHHIVSR